ncbi:MAG: MFS transporter [Clostridium sp.]|uniref:MFS transporter n=1 Tax=Clostridium sp. TaxID=1506 RepID=UPI0039E8CA9F
MDKFPTKDKIILGFIILNIISGTSGGILQMVIPLYSLSINASTAQIGIIKGVSGLGMLLLVLPSGFLIDYYGSRKLYIVGSVIGAIIIFTFSFIKLPIFLIIGMGIQGFTNSLRFTSLNAAFFKNLKTIGKKKSGWYKGSMSIGLTFIGPFIGGYIVQNISYKWIFVLIGMMILIPSLILYILSDKSIKSKPENLIQIFKEQYYDLKLLLRNNIIKQTALVESISTACFSTFVTFIIVLVVSNYHLKSIYASWLIIMEGSAFIITVFLGGHLLYKFKASTLYLESFILVIVGTLIVVFQQSITFIALGTIIMGLGLGMTNLITYSRVGEIEGKKGKISGLFAACTGIGASLGPTIGGFIGQRFSIKFVFLIYVPLFVLLGFYIIFKDLKMTKKSYEIENCN